MVDGHEATKKPVLCPEAQKRAATLGLAWLQLIEAGHITGNAKQWAHTFIMQLTEVFEIENMPRRKGLDS